ncbi:MAG: hypothetical protein IPJ50_19415 [Betaproteobacteria bacterium]|nr:hypothetical protein [Betaproteobacteria bacterium]MBP6747554.1 hypothetical protein [bacterium]
MSEFNNRIAAQRDILLGINSASWQEELFGLSSGAIERWISANRLDPSSDLVALIRQAANKLFFLSNKSQEQITEDYKLLSREVTALTEQINSSIYSLKECRSPT